MQHESLSESQLKLLRPVDHNTLKVGDSVYSRSGNLFQVAATPGPNGDVATRNHVGNICMHRACWLKLAPLFWLEDKPVYPGDTLYWADHTTWGSLEVINSYHGEVIGNTHKGGIRIRERFLSWNEVRWLEDQLLCIGDTVYKKEYITPLTVHSFTQDCVFTSPSDWISLKYLTRTKPEPEVLVEGQPVVVGETLYVAKDSSSSGSVAYVKDGYVYITAPYGEIGIKPEHLTRTDPTILFEVDGKPVRKGDKLFPTSAYHYGEERTIVGVNERGVYATTNCGHKGSINSLTREAPTLVEIDGVCVRIGDSAWHRDTGNLWEVVSFNKLHKTMFCKNMQGGHTSFKADQVSMKPPLFHLKGKAIFAGDKVWTMSGDEVEVLGMGKRGVVITTESRWSGCTRFNVEWLSAIPIARLAVDGVEVKKGDKLFDKATGKPVIVYRQVWDRVEQSSGGSWTADMLTRTDPAQELVEVPIWVSCYVDGTTGFARFARNRHPEPSSLLGEVEGTLKVPKHIADKLKR